MKYAAGKGIGIIVMEPLLGGKLAGNIPPEVEKIWNKSHYRWTPAERAFRYVWNYPEVQVVLSGMSTLEHVKENIVTASDAKPESILPDELKLYQKVRKVYLSKMVVHCTGCGYCLPCPAKVAIPWSLGMYNDAHIFSDKQRHQWEYNFFIPDDNKADKCTKCGACIAKCPQKINIPSELENVAAFFTE